MDSSFWDERYRATELVWSAGPNQFLVEHVAGLAVGSALDVACGEGRNAIWLAEQGWTATGSDFSAVGIDKARAIAAERGVEVNWQVADATSSASEATYDLVIVFYLHLTADQRRAAHRAAAAAVAPGGTLLIVGHDRDNLEHGVGGPPDPKILLTGDEVTNDLIGTGLEIEQAGQVTRPVDVDGQTQHAIDCLVRAHRRT